MGLRNNATVLAERLMQEGVEHVTTAVIDAAKGGDMTACKLVLERILPARRGAPVRVELPAIESVEDVVEAASRITAHVAAGGISPDEGAAMTAIVDFTRRAIETADLARRIEALEQKGPP